MGLLNFINRRPMDEGPLNQANGVQDGSASMTASVQSLQPRRLPSREKLPHSMVKRRSMNILPGSGKSYLTRHGTGNNGSEPSLSLRSYHSANKLHQTISTETKSLTPSILSVSVTGRSIHSSKASGHIDLLDAQGGIRPCDFRTRINAAGVRDYGEDVAERNMGENGVDVQSAAAKDFYRRKMNKKQSFYTDKTADTIHVLEADQFTSGGSTDGDGSDNGDVASVDGTAICSASLSRLSLQPESNAAGQLKASRAKSWNPKAFEAALALASAPRLSRRELFDIRQEDATKRQTNSTLSRERSLERKLRTSAAISASESREAHVGTRDRSMSPPNVPRYRTHHDLQSPTETELTSISHEAFDSDLDPAAMSDDDILEYGISLPAAVPIRSARPRLIAVAPQHTNAEWQSAIRTAVEESLASLPQTTDLKALLELSSDALSLSDVTDQVPPRHSSLRQGYISCSSTPTTVTSGYASSTTGRPHSRQTTATSIDFSTQIDPYSKIGYGGSSDGRGSSVGHHHHATQSADLDDLVRPHVAFDLPPKSKHEELSLCQPYGCVEVHDLDSFTSDLSDVDSFTTARCRAPDDESLLFNEDKFADAGSNLPGLVTAANNCMICHVVANLQGTPVPTVPCDHNGTTTRKQRLRALGYDYDSDESEPEPITTSPRTRTKWLTSGVNGGLRRLKLVDDCIEEASDEEEPPLQEIRRKHKFSELRTAHEDGNLADTE